MYAHYLNCFKELAVTKQISALPVSTSEPTPVKPDLVGSPSKVIVNDYYRRVLLLNTGL
jgi:hypothetical protein